jgi:hypothetical protein
MALANIYPDGTVYNGEWKNDLYNGDGSIMYTNGTSYTGGFKESKYHGTGTLKWTSGLDFVDTFNINDFTGLKKDTSGNFLWTGEFNLRNLK